MPQQNASLKRLTVKLNAIGKSTQREVSDALRRCGLRIENRAAEKMASEPKTGRVYRRGKGGKIKHQASAPGEAPAVDTGRLVQSLTTVMTDSGPDRYAAETGIGIKNIGGELGSQGKIAIALELGTKKMAPRPFLGPAFDDAREQNLEDIKKAIVRGALGKTV